MRILDRYITQPGPDDCAFAVGVLSLAVLVLGNVFKQLLDLLVNHDVPLETILSFIAYIIPFSLTFTIPWGFLTAVLLIFGRLSAENELIALRSNGVSIPRICMPVFGLALICVGICFYINVDVAPKAQEQMKAALYNIATSNPIAMFGSDQPIDQFPEFPALRREKRRGTKLENILMYQLSERGEPLLEVHAKTGELRTDLKEKQQIILHLNDAQYEQHDASHPDNLMDIRPAITAQQNDLAISLKELYEKNKKKRSTSQMMLNELVNKTTGPTTRRRIRWIRRRFRRSRRRSTSGSRSRWRRLRFASSLCRWRSRRTARRHRSALCSA